MTIKQQMKAGNPILTAEHYGRNSRLKILSIEYQHRVGDEIYVVYFDFQGDYTKPFSYFIGCKVKTDTDVPKGMENLVIAENNYMKLTAKGPCRIV